MFSWNRNTFNLTEESGLDQDYNVRGVPRLVAVDIDGNVIKDSERDGPVEMLDELVETFFSLVSPQ